MDGRSEQPEEHDEDEHRGDDVTIPATDHENCRGHHRDERPAEQHRRERRELPGAPNDHHEKHETQRGDRGQALAHVVIPGLGRQAEQQAAEPPLPGLFRGPVPSAEEAHDLTIVQRVNRGRALPKYP